MRSFYGLSGFQFDFSIQAVGALRFYMHAYNFRHLHRRSFPKVRHFENLAASHKTQRLLNSKPSCFIVVPTRVLLGSY